MNCWVRILKYPVKTSIKKAYLIIAFLLICHQNTAECIGPQCIICLAGKFKGYDGLEACTSCPPNTYSTSIGAITESTCLSCPTNSNSPAGSNNISKCICDAGSTGPDGGTCTPCAAGTYKNATGSEDCTACPAASTSPAGSLSVVDCLCTAGQTLDGYTLDGAPICSPCPLSTYKVENKNQACVPCSPNSASSRGSTSAEACLCEQGYTGPDGGSCSACAAGTFKSSPGSAACLDCEEGTVKTSEGPGGCSVCPANSAPNAATRATQCQCIKGYAGANASSCAACAVGKYSNVYEATSCINCPDNTRTASSAADSIVACLCLEGYEKLHGAQLCTACPLGTYKSELHSERTCAPCSTGGTTTDTRNTDASGCVATPGHTFLGVNIFEACGVNTFKDSTDNSACTLCPVGATTSGVAKTAFSDCNCTGQGYWNRGDDTQECGCAPGFAEVEGGAGGAFTCEPCAADHWCPGSNLEGPNTHPAGTQQPCHLNSQSPIGSSSASECQCNAGYGGSEGGATCQPCLSNTFKAGVGNTACDSCPADSLSPASSTSVSDCLCNAGYTGANGGTCTVCAAGTFKTSIGSAGCSGCTSDSDSPSGSTSAADCLCNAGYGYSDVSSEPTCSPCEEDSYKSARANEACSLCPANSTALLGSDKQTDCLCNAGFTGPDGGVCSPCNSGSYKPSIGSAGCDIPPTNSRAVEGVGYACNAGYVKYYTSLQTATSRRLLQTGFACVACYAGKYEANGVCRPCPASSSSPSASDQLTDCLCVAGYSGPDGGTCEECPADTYKTATGSAECSDCPASSTSGAGSDEQTDCLCDAGSTGSDGGPCTACEGGTYKSGTGSAECSICPSSSSSLVGSDAQTDCLCNVGYTGPDGGDCTACPLGTFKDTPGSDDCTSCPAASTSPLGSSDQEACVCVPGYTLTATSTCSRCPADTYKDANGNQACSTCPAQSVSLPGSDVLTDCQCLPGFSGPDGGPCTICGAGGYKAGGGPAACSTCPNHSSSPPGSDALTDCQCLPGFSGPDGGPCTVCGEDEYKNATGPQTCAPCLPFSSSPPGSTSLWNCSCLPGFKGDGGIGCHKECPAGFEGVDGRCEGCATSFYKPGFGDQACTRCPEFAHMAEGTRNQSTSALCVCESGHVWDPETGTCRECSPGTFNNEANSTVCHTCYTDAGGTCVASTSPSPRSCPAMCRAPAGYELLLGTTDKVQLCAANHFQDGSALTCTGCPSPSSQTLRGGLRSLRECTCLPGYTRGGISSDQLCTPCPHDTFKPGPGDQLCTTCPEHAITLGEAATEQTACLCDAAYEPGEPGGAACVRCLDTGAKHVPGNVPCIRCPADSTLNETLPHLASSCRCDPGYTGPPGACYPCAAGFFKASSGPHACTPCAEHASTSGPGAVSRSRCECVATYEDANGGPSLPSGGCVSSCVPGTTSDGISCHSCAQGTYKADLGPAPCTECPSPRNASRVGAVAAANCSCRGGELDVDPAGVAVITALGDLSDIVSEAKEGQSILTEPACWEGLAFAAATTDSTDSIRIALTRHGVDVQVFRCDSQADCAHQLRMAPQLPLWGTCGALSLQSSHAISIQASRYTGRAAVLETAPGATWDPTQVRTHVLERALRVGDFLFSRDRLESLESLQSLTHCVPCPPGLVCTHHV
jgi:hypothetical protein